MGITRVISHFCTRKIGIVRRIATGIEQSKIATSFKFQGVESNRFAVLEDAAKQVSKRGDKIALELYKDKAFMKSLNRFIEKSGIKNVDISKMSQEEILELIMQKSGVGPCKFAQIISSDETIMRRFSPKLQEIIKKVQSDNPFSRSLAEAQEALNMAFPNISQRGINVALPTTMEYTLTKPLSAGTVGEAYLAKDKAGKEVVVKMIKKNVDKEQLLLEEDIFSRLIKEFAKDETTANKYISMLKNLYKDWSKELNFRYEYKYNKMLQQGSVRYKVADITHISPDASCIVMEKAEGIQMNRLLEMLKFYKSNPQQFASKYAKEISEHPWLSEPQKIIEELPESITKTFDEMFLFMKKGGKSITHGDPHMGNYFITTDKNGKLVPMFIDTGNCIVRSPKQIQADIQFLADYFVGNSKGLAKYFVSQCVHDSSFAPNILRGYKALPKSKNTQEELINKISEEIQNTIFGKSHNVSDVDAVQKSIQAILEKYGLTLHPEASTMLKAQMQFYSGINEVSSLSGRQIDVGTIVKDVPEALFYMIKSHVNPFSTVNSALKFAYNNQTQASRTIYQFLGNSSQAGNCTIRMSTPADFGYVTRRCA